jgi:glycosyltransferase involved in cell wall biosynthesis
MKIAVFYYIEFSGAKRVVMEHVKGLKSLGNSVDLYTTDKVKDIFDPGAFSDNKYLYDFSPMELHLPILNRIKKDFFDTFISLRILHKKIARDIDKRKYDVVLVHTDINTQSPFLLRYLKTKNIYFCLEPLRNGYEYSLRLKDGVSVFNKFYEDLNRWIRKRIDIKNTLSADSTLALSLFGRERMIAAYDLYPKISYLGIDEKIFRPKKLEKKRQVFFVAEKYPIYGYDLAKDAIDLIPKEIRPDLKIVSWRKNNAERLKDEELVDLYNQSLITLSLSRFDTFGLVPLESMACGVPVISLNVAGYRETVLNGETGYLTDFSPKEIAEKIIYLIKHPRDAEKMGRSGRKWVEDNWTWEKQILKLNDILLNFVKS